MADEQNKMLQARPEETVFAFDMGDNVQLAACVELRLNADGTRTITGLWQGEEAEVEIARRQASEKARAPKGVTMENVDKYFLGQAHEATRKAFEADLRANLARETAVLLEEIDQWKKAFKPLHDFVLGKFPVAAWGKDVMRVAVEKLDGALAEIESLRQRVHPSFKREHMDALCRYLNTMKHADDVYPGIDIAKLALMTIQKQQARIAELETECQHRGRKLDEMGALIVELRSAKLDAEAKLIERDAKPKGFWRCGECGTTGDRCTSMPDGRNRCELLEGHPMLHRCDRLVWSDKDAEKIAAKASPSNHDLLDVPDQPPKHEPAYEKTGVHPAPLDLVFVGWAKPSRLKWVLRSVVPTSGPGFSVEGIDKVFKFDEEGVTWRWPSP